MKPLRIFMLMALLVLPLFASSVLADFTADTVNIGFGGNKKISENTVNQPILGFWIPKVGDDTLKTVILKSYIERAYSVGFVKLWVETNNTPGWQITDTHLKTVNTLLNRFETQDTIVFSGLNRVIKADRDTFYFTIDAHTDSVKATPYLFNEHGLDVVIEEGRIALGASSGQTNNNRLANLGWNPGPPPFFDPFKLIFDTYGPTFDLHFCIEDNTCSTYTYYGSGWSRLLNVDQEDSVRICAKNVSPDIMGDITVIGNVHLLGYVSSLHMFGVSNIKLQCPDVDQYGCGEGDCDSCYTTGFRIPDAKNTGGFNGVDADSGHWYVCAYASDSSGNVDTMCIGHEDLPYRIDTQKPKIDSITWEFADDVNGNGIINVGDAIMIIGWGLSNSWEPVFECAKMQVDTAWMSGGTDTAWVELNDILEHNRVFRRVFRLTTELPIDSTGGCPVNFLVRAWDNACNYDTLTGEICADMDLDPPDLEVLYEWHTDYDTMWACLGIGDKALIRASVADDDIIVSVTADMATAGIDELVRHAMPLPNRGGGVYDTIWTITEPPIIDGKDADNTVPPPIDNDYTVNVTACDDGGNCVTVTSNILNKTLDTRRPRPIGYFCPDSVPCALHAVPLAGGKIDLYWDKDCDENDAFYFYVWASFEGAPYESLGATNIAEQLPGDFNFWHSEPLAEGYWTFKIKTEDNCSNVGDFSCEVSVLVDTTPPNACIVYPDSGLTQGYPFPIKARSEDQDIDTVCLWYRLWPNYPSDEGRTQWYFFGCMDRYDDGFVFLYEDFFIHNYVGWVEVLPLSCDVIGNCQDTTEAYADACLDDDLGNLVDGHFLYYTDTTACMVKVVSVNDTLSPQTSCGYNVTADAMNQIIINVIDAGTDLFTIDVRAIVDNSNHRIDYRNHVTMPCTLWVSVDNWDQGTQSIFVHVESEENGHDCIPHPLEIELCVPPQEAPCMQITDPVEWQRIPCSKTDKTEVCITAETIEGCGNETVTQVEFRVSATGEPPWYYIGEDITPIQVRAEPLIMDSWEVCWNNKEFIEQNNLQDGDPVYLIAIGYDQYHMADTSHMVKVYLDCTSPNIQLFMEPLYHTCTQEDSVISCGPLTFKAIVLDTLVDYKEVHFFAKKHTDPDIYDYWHDVCSSVEPWSDNLWQSTWADPCTCVVDDLQDLQGTFGLCSGLLYDFRIGAEDQADNEFLDYDEDGRFDDSTFNMAVALGAGMTLMVDGEAPQVAIAMVADSLAPIYNVNPSEILGGSGKAYVKAHDPITIWIVPEPSEDTCEVYKVEYWLGFVDTTQNPFDTTYHHVSTGTVPNHFPITFNPWELPEIIPHYEFEDGWWQGPLKAVLYDSLENSSEDIITLYILDVDPSQALIVEPLNDSYVWGDVTLKVKALNAYEICKVVYEYRPLGDSVWYPILNGVSESPDSFMVSWHTPLVTDGIYCLRARAMDCSNNWDEDPHTICVHVANTPPSVVMDDPRICERTCPDDTVDTLGYVSGTVELYATATSSSAPVTKVSFYYKSIFGYPDTWALIGTDDFPTADKYSVLWDAGARNDGRYHLMARVYNAAGRYNDSDPVTVSVDNSGPFAQIISIDGNPFPDGMDITKGDVLDIELVAIDSTSNEGWTRCYNSGLTTISVCIENCKSGEELTKCFAVDPVEDGIRHVQWNTSGLEFTGCEGCYYFYVKATDCLGNTTISDTITVYVSDITAPVTTIGGFDGNTILGYSDEKVSSLLFEYTLQGTDSWIPIGWSEYLADCGGYYLYATTWDPTALADGDYWVRVISHDTCSNQDDSLAPIAIITVAGGEITPYNPEVLGEMTFEKNWCVGGMQGIVRETCSDGTPVMIAYYGGTDGECVDMQYHLQNTTEYAGSFFADEIDHGGTAKFFSSITVPYSPPPSTGEPKYVTYLNTGSFTVVQVKRDLGTHGIYEQGDCPIEVTIPQGAVGSTFQYDRYIWVAPTMLEWAPVTQPNIKPIGDNNGFATYVSFTDCYYGCGYHCGWYSTHFKWEEATPPQQAPGDNSDDCCFNPGRYAKIKMCYDSTITTDAAHLAVMWWDCEDGEFKSDNIFYPATVEGFDTENHTVEFATTCLNGPFAVVELIERQCDGSIVVNMLDVEPYCKGYTNATPQFKAKITDRVQGTSAIDQSTIQFKTDLFTPGELDRIYDGSKSGDCAKWAIGFGSFKGAGYDEVLGIFRAGWSDSTYYNNTDGCWYNYSECSGYYCRPMYPLAEGDHIAVVTAMNDQIQTCTDTAHIMVDATKPWMAFADSIGAYVGKNPYICMYFNDALSGVDKGSIWIDLFEDDTNDPDPNGHSYVATIHPDQLKWVNDTTVCFDFTFENYVGGYLHLYVYGGPQWKCYEECPNTQYYGYLGGIADCVGNRLGSFWQYYTIDAYGPIITPKYLGSICDASLRFEITDAMSGVLSVTVSEDDVVKDQIVQDGNNPNYWWYTPSEGVEKITIEAIDKLGNKTYYSFTKGNCLEPTVKFENEYVCKNPTIKFWVTDPDGVDWSKLNVYVDGCGEYCSYFASDLTNHINTSTGLVTLDDCNLDCYDGQVISTYVYSGTSKTGTGPCDLLGNCGTYRLWSFVVDEYPPDISVGSTADRPILITITDDKSGVDWSSVMFYEDGVLLCEGFDCTSDLVVFDTINGTISYTPEAFGKDITIKVTDKTGCNVATAYFTTEEDFLSFGNPHNSPNPFDPNSEETWIYPELSKSAYVTIKIYDFAGEFVRKICDNEWMNAGSYRVWDGKTDGGTTVGNGTYLCYIHARDESGRTKTAVIKITVLKQDE